MTRKPAAVPLFLLAACAAFSQVTPAAAPADRCKVVPGTDLAALLKKPVVLGSDYRSYKDEAAGEWRMLGEGEVHALLDVPGRYLADVSTDYDGQTKVFPRVIRAKVIYREGNKWVAEQYMGFRFLGFVAGYDTIFNAEWRDYPDGSIVVECSMKESLDQKLFDSYALWYFAPATVDGRQMTYARFYSRQGVRKPFAGMAGLVNAFADAELRKLVDETAREARKRAGLPAK